MYQGEDVVGASELDFAQVLQQGKPVVLNFWAGLCPPCRAEMPSFQRMYDERQDELILIGVDIGPFIGLGSIQDARRLLKELQVSYPTGQALSAQTVRQFNVLSMPTTIFFDASGREVNRHAGFLTEDQLRGQVDKLLSSA